MITIITIVISLLIIITYPQKQSIRSSYAVAKSVCIAATCGTCSCSRQRFLERLKELSVLYLWRDDFCGFMVQGLGLGGGDPKPVALSRRTLKKRSLQAQAHEGQDFRCAASVWRGCFVGKDARNSYSCPKHAMYLPSTVTKLLHSQRFACNIVFQIHGSFCRETNSFGTSRVNLECRPCEVAAGVAAWVPCCLP